jgi:hypothetical protein
MFPLRRTALLPLLTLLLVACDEAVGPVPEALSEAAVEQLAQAIAESEELRLPSLGALLRASRAAIEAQGGNDEAVGHFRRARRLRNAAETAHEAGHSEEARRLARRARGETLSGIVAALGSEAVRASVAGSRAGLTRVEERLAGRDVPEGVARRVERIGGAIDRAEEALDGGAEVRALHFSLVAADGVRGLSPRWAARRWIARATETLAAARAAVGDAPTEDETTALQRAARLLGAARDDLDQGRPVGALERARRSTHLSWGVVQGRSD